MLQENFNEEINPRDIEDSGTSSEREKEVKDEEESYDILPSNSAGLEGNDGEQVISGDDDDDEDEDD